MSTKREDQRDALLSALWRGGDLAYEPAMLPYTDERCAVAFSVTDKGRDALMRSEGYESNPLSLFRERQRLNGALTIAEQAAWIRNRSSDDDSSSAQPHRFRSAE